MTDSISTFSQAVDLDSTIERSRAELAADFANTFLMQFHRGAIRCGDYFILYGNDGYATDQRSRIEAADVWEKLRQHDPEQGRSSNGHTWALVVTDYSRNKFNEEKLNTLVWDTWMEVCDRFKASEEQNLKD